ncbi:MAG: cell wall hydrolase [Erythrobacter sp.]
MLKFKRIKAGPKAIRLPDLSKGQVGTLTKLPLKRRLMALCAAIAVPAMAAPGDFGAMPADAPFQSHIRVDLADTSSMPFERPGSSFPGSAFFYLADPPAESLIALPSFDPLESEDSATQVGELIEAGPSANPFFTAGGGTSHARALSCLAQAVYYEAASESTAGQRAVAQVVLNRVSHPNWPASVCGVVYQGSNRSTGCQFSFTCDGSLSRRPSAASLARARLIASDALSGDVYAPIGHATHYHTHWVNPYWASSLEHVGTIGAHRFYRSRGAAGRSGAFTQSYAGVEPGANERSQPVEVAGITPVPNLDQPTQASFTSGGNGASAVRAAATPPSANIVGTPDAALADQSLVGAGQVRQDYSNAGQWKDGAAAALAAQEAESIAAESFADGAGNAND